MNAPYIGDLLKGSPTNWGRWGSEDEVGGLNYLGVAEVRRAASLVRSGKVFTLQQSIGSPCGDPVWPGRRPAEHYMLLDESDYVAGNGPRIPGGFHYADDAISMNLQGSTQYDALGHVWFDSQMWNGYDAISTYGGLKKASVHPVAERGIVGRGVLLDVARHRNLDSLASGETITHEDLEECARSQGVELRARDVLLIRTGWLESYSEKLQVGNGGFNEPGLTYSPELVEWFYGMEIPNFGTDTMGNEVTQDPVLGVNMPLHCALMRNLGVLFTEMCNLKMLAEDCAEDHQYDFMYCAAPLKVVAGSGSPVNPLAIK